MSHKNLKKNIKNKKQLRPLLEGFNQIISLDSDPKDIKKRYSVYDVPNSPRP